MACVCGVCVCVEVKEWGTEGATASSLLLRLAVYYASGRSRGV